MEQKTIFAIQTENLSKTYRLSGGRRVEALKKLAITVPRGKRIFIEGPSGSGKSTLLNLLGCLDRPTSGRILHDGADISEFSEEELCRIRRETIGFVFQEFNLLPRMPAWENVSAGLVPLGFREKERFRRASLLLEQLGLGERVDHFPEEMSGGEQQRVCVARALINDPEILLADEPISNIDAASAAKVIGAFDALCKNGRTLVIATHSSESVRNMFPDGIARETDIVCRLLDGRIATGL